MRGVRAKRMCMVLAAALVAGGCSRGPEGRSDYREIIYMVVPQMTMAGTVPAETSGVVKLPPRLAAATVTGEVYVTRAPSGAVLILFVTWQGKGTDIRGYLYASKPLGPDDTTTDVAGRQRIRLLGPMPPGESDTEAVLPTPIDRQITEKISENWYAVFGGSD
jgi:hypothetical protein